MSLWEYIRAELAVLKGAPVSFVGLVVLSIAAGIGIGEWHYSERLETKDGEIHRYRVALGIDNASAGALVELNNQELALKAQYIVGQMRQLSSALDQKGQQIGQMVKDGKIDKQRVSEAKMAAIKEVSEAFNSNLASDAYNVENELRSRLDPSALSHIVRVPAFIVGSDPRSRVTFSELMRGSGFDAMMIGRLADEMEEMAKLLPPDSRKP
jgi:hypothetical protein